MREIIIMEGYDKNNWANLIAIIGTMVPTPNNVSILLLHITKHYWFFEKEKKKKQFEYQRNSKNDKLSHPPPQLSHPSPIFVYALQFSSITAGSKGHILGRNTDNKFPPCYSQSPLQLALRFLFLQTHATSYSF
jgi:hypothetical protein